MGDGVAYPRDPREKCAMLSELAEEAKIYRKHPQGAKDQVRRQDLLSVFWGRLYLAKE